MTTRFLALGKLGWMMAPLSETVKVKSRRNRWGGWESGKKMSLVGTY